MDNLLFSSAVERTADKPLRILWSRKTAPLKTFALFNKIKHSEEWHQNVEATTGILRPSDSKFPYGFMQNHTNAYLRKKGKISQTDADVRLAVLIQAHDTRDIGIAAAAHAMSAKSVRALLPAELNVAQGSYWGLETWLQCLIAANHSNPASVTDLEALWARNLLPYATHGACAAGLYLMGVSRALRRFSTPNMNVLPEFSVLLRRALTDYAAQLEGFRLRRQWVAAHEAVSWMVDLERTSPAVTPPGHLLLEHILDSQYPAWRLWAGWRPDVNRIDRLANHGSAKLATIPDIVALEGPDVLLGRLITLREGLIEQYGSGKPWIRFEALVIEVPDRTKDGLRNILEGLAKGLESVTVGKASDPGHESMFRLFRDLFVTQPSTLKGLNLFEAAVKIPYTPENDIYNTVREVYSERESLGGQNMLALQRLIRALDEPRAEDLRKFLLRSWLLQGIESCIQDCQAAIRIHIDWHLPWTCFATELHTFYMTIKGSRNSLSLVGPHLTTQLEDMPPVKQMEAILEVYTAAQAQRPKLPRLPSEQEQKEDGDIKSHDSIKQVPAPSNLMGEPEMTRHPLETVIETFCIHRLLEPGKISRATQRTISAILHVWESTAGPQVDNDRRSLAILVAKHTGGDDDLRCRCLVETALKNNLLEPPTFVKDLLAIIVQAEVQPERAIIEFTKLLAKRRAWTQCWKDLLFRWLEREGESGLFRSTNLIKYSLQTMKAAEWLSFIHSLETLFIDNTFFNTEEGRNVPPILQPQLLNWKTQVSRFTRTLTRLEGTLDYLDAVRSILICGEGFWSKNLLSILGCLEKVEGKPVETLMQKMVGKLSAKTKNDWEVRECFFSLSKATPETIQVCEKIWGAKHGFLDIPYLHVPTQTAERPLFSKRSFIRKTQSIRPTASSQSAFSTQQPHPITSPAPAPTPIPKVNVPLSVAEVMVAGWVQDGSVDVLQRVAIESVACLLNLEVYQHAIPQDKLLEATLFWENIEKEIIKEADRLEALQKALKAKDPKGTALLLEELGVSDNSLLDEEMTSLPAGVASVVEKVGDNEVEISFPLTSYTQLQRDAMGVPKAANILLLRLFIDHSGDMPPSFCLHFNNEPNLDALEHSPWICSEEVGPPQANICNSVQTAFTWQLNRILHTQLRSGNVGIADLHGLVKKRMQELGHSCISCGASHNAKNAQLRRSTPCDVLSCTRLWYQLPLEVRVPEIKTDTFAVDMMLTSVYVAASTSKSELLPGCPFYSDVVKAILNTLPRLSELSAATGVSTVLTSCHPHAEKLISWTCVHFRGYLATATGLCKIPNLHPGTHQFVLVHASPSLEAAFVARLAKHKAASTVLFHGTSLDRLPAILAQGLKICSGTSLQRTGAAHGKGIYMAEDPATSFTYAPASLSWRNSALPSMRLLLGCEVAGGGKSVNRGIHVVTDEKSVMVRYVFLFTMFATSPVANHIVPAMASAMRALRTGAV